MLFSKTSLAFLLTNLSTLVALSAADNHSSTCSAPSKVVCKKVDEAPTLDGDLSDWSSIDAVTTPITGAASYLTYEHGDMAIKCSYDDENIYFAISVPGKYRYDSSDDHLCAAISTMMKIGEDAEFHDMGACPEAMAGCPNGVPEVCESYLVDVGAHWELKTTEQGALYVKDVETESGNDLIANKDDEYAVSSYCRKDDGGPNSGNEWSGAWVHNVDTSMPTEYTTVDGTDGTYIFEMSRLLTTASAETDAQLAENNTYSFGLAFWDPWEFDTVGWTKIGHYVTGCSDEWMSLVIGEDVTSVVDDDALPEGSSSFNTIAKSASVVALMTIGMLLM